MPDAESETDSEDTAKTAGTEPKVGDADDMERRRVILKVVSMKETTRLGTRKMG